MKQRINLSALLVAVGCTKQTALPTEANFRGETRSRSPDGKCTTGKFSEVGDGGQTRMCGLAELHEHQPQNYDEQSSRQLQSIIFTV